MPSTLAQRCSALAVSLFALYWPANGLAQLGSSYCPAVANSTGAAARIVVMGSLDVSLGQLELRCEGLPAASVGVFLFGQSAASLPGHAGSVGTLCLAAPFVRDPLGALQATASGVVRRRLDLSQVPLLGGPAAVIAGDTLRIQYWYRDTNPLGSTANSSDGQRLTFSASLPDAAEVLVETGRRPRIEAGDLDGDGMLDIVAVGTEGRVTVHRHLGARTFEERTRLELGEVAADIALGDLDGDGDLDVAIALPGSGRIALLTNDGAGALERQGDLIGLPDVALVRSSDLDGDGALDLIAVLGGGSGVASEVRSLRSVGGLQFSVLDRHVGAAGLGQPALAVGDLDGDQAEDVFFVELLPLGAPTSTTTVLLNDGAGAWTARSGPSVTGPIGGAFLTDIDGDGALDVLLRTVTGAGTFTQHSSSTLFRGDGLGGFHQPPSVYPAFVIAPPEDIDRDGDPDLIGSVVNSGFAILENRGSGLHAVPSRALLSIGGEARLADLDGDGAPELLLPKFWEAAVGVRRIGPGLRVDEDEYHTISPRPDEVTRGDLDGDGDVDFVAWSGVHATVLENLGARLDIVAPNLWMGPNPQQVMIFDVDGDQSNDLVAVLRDSSPEASRRVRRGLGGFTYGPLVQHAGVRGVTRAAHGDLDGDGREDVVLASEGGLALCLNDGAGGFQAPVRLGGSTLTRDVALVDLDRDGALDIIAAEAPLATVAVYRGDGSGGFGARTAVSVGADPSGLASGDWDLDGWSDLVVRCAGDGTLQALMNDGTGALRATPPFSVGAVTDRIGVGDLDGDGLPDLALATDFGESVRVWSGLGDGTFGPRRAYAVPRPARNVLPVDVDGDGALELVALLAQIGGFVIVLR